MEKSIQKWYEKKWFMWVILCFLIFISVCLFIIVLLTRSNQSEKTVLKSQSDKVMSEEINEAATEKVVIDIDSETEGAKALTELNAEIDETQSAYRTIQSAIDEYNTTGELSIDMLQSLLAMDSKYLEMLELESENLVVNKEKLETYHQTLTDKLKAKINAQIETEKNIS